MGGSSLTGGDGRDERRPGFRAAGAAAARIVGPIVVRQGGAVLARLKAEWAAIVGPEVAQAAWPESLGRGGALRLRVLPHKALEIQHRAPLVIERVNLFFGREAATRLALVQGPLPLASIALGREMPRPLQAGEAAVLEQDLAGIDDPELRRALDRLGRAVIGSDAR